MTAVLADAGTVSSATPTPLAKRATVTGLGYVILTTTDLPGWARFGTHVLGLQIGRRTEELIEFRADNKEYRLVVRRGSANSVDVAGWEVDGADALAQISARLRGCGYDVTPLSDAERRDRRVTAGARLSDPDGLLTLELHYGLRDSNDRFVSPVGATFVTGDLGLGHILQIAENWDAINELYVDLLGFELSDHIETDDQDLTFLHCNRRHHSFAFAKATDRPAGIGHIMLEVTELDIVGRAADKALYDDAAPVLSTLGKHTNDKMVSVYVASPSGLGIEYGTGGIAIDDNWKPARYSEAHYWGHRKP